MRLKYFCIVVGCLACVIILTPNLIHALFPKPLEVIQTHGAVVANKTPPVHEPTPSINIPNLIIAITTAFSCLGIGKLLERWLWRRKFSRKPSYVVIDS